MKIGGAENGSGKKTLKIEGDKSLATGVFRILPALGSLADQNRYFKKYEVEWGYKGSDNKMKPFLNCRKLDFDNPEEYVDEKTGDVKKRYPVLVESAAHLKRQEVKAHKDAIVAAFKKGEATEDQVKDAVEQVKRYNLDVKYYYNVVNLKNEIGLLKLNSTFHKGLQAAIKKFKEENDGVNPISDGSVSHTGIYFSFRRTNATGKISDYVFEVTPYLKKNDDGSLNLVKHNLDEKVISRLEAEAHDLGDMYPALNAEQTAEVVNGGPEAVDRLLGNNNTNQTATNTNTATQTTTQAATTAAQNVAETITQAETAVQSADEKLAAMGVDTSTNTTASTTVTTQATGTTGTTGGSAVSNEEFLASIGATE